MLNSHVEFASMPAFAAADAGSNRLYLDLMKRCLTDLIYIDHPLAQYHVYRAKSGTPAWKRALANGLERALLRYRLRLVEPFGPELGPEISAPRLQEQRVNGEGWPARAHTMIGMKALDNLQHCVETALREGVPGDLIETGVWRGGACILMRAVLEAHEDADRVVWVADSFSGLPPPSEDYPADAGDVFHMYDEMRVSLPEVRTNFARYGLLDDRVRFLQGWFKDTLPSAPIERLAVLRLDSDMYESTIQVLDALYGKLSPGGFVIVDDYWLKPCAQAVHDFRQARAIGDEIWDINGRAAYWRRSR
jgi:O-methyltransferase